MMLLVLFEDRYGLYDISTLLFNINTHNSIDKTVFINNNDTFIHIESGIGNAGILNYNTGYKDYDKIIVVYDMDGPGGGKQNYLTSGRFNKNVKNKIIKLRAIDKYLFVPTIFCSETITLHRFDPNTIDFSQTYSNKNTAYMHGDILEDLLGAKNIKRTHEYIGTKEDIKKALIQTMNNNFSDLNKPYLDWVLSGDILNTSSLLDFESALKFQETFEKRIQSAIKHNKTGVRYNGRNYE